MPRTGSSRRWCSTPSGLPAALAYRFINTADAMLGYHDAEREWLGKMSARLDDLVNLVPARLTAGLLLLGHLAARRTDTPCLAGMVA